MKALGIIFIIIGVLCSLGGYLNTMESHKEELTRKWYEASQNAKEVGEGLDRISRNLEALGGGEAEGGIGNNYDQSIAESSSAYNSLRNEREEKMKWFFLAGVSFVVLGLVLTVAAPKKA